ncbi:MULTISPECIES: hypothetical protein [unclassified Paenibacillus]|nr:MULTISPECIES: hypothetical protein [unclassified Paenibacillus]SEO47204.1 hypothetical protein SAMN05518670_4031 [Paenibacillus sp. OK076]
MTPLLKAMNDWGEGHIDHLDELYGEDSTTELLNAAKQNRR